MTSRKGSTGTADAVTSLGGVGALGLLVKLKRGLHSNRETDDREQILKKLL